MKVLERLFGKGGSEIVSRGPVAKFKVRECFGISERRALSGEVTDGVIYPGYKIKGRKVALIRRIEIGNRAVDFAVSGDKAVLILEGEFPCVRGEVNVYRS